MSLRLAFDLRSIALDRHDGSLFEENLDAATLVSQARVEDRGRASNYGGRRAHQVRGRGGRRRYVAATRGHKMCI